MSALASKRVDLLGQRVEQFGFWMLSFLFQLLEGLSRLSQQHRLVVMSTAPQEFYGLPDLIDDIGLNAAGHPRACLLCVAKIP